MAVVKTESALSVAGNEQQSPYCLNNGGTTANANCCASCRMPIKDRFIFRVIEQNFHQECVRCIDCSQSLNERCYTFAGKLYCRTDYNRRFGPKCSACQEPINPTELVQRLKENLVYHLSCFVCQDCKRHLQAGEQLHFIDEKRLLCKRDFINHQHQHQHQNQSAMSGVNCNNSNTPTPTITSSPNSIKSNPNKSNHLTGDFLNNHLNSNQHLKTANEDNEQHLHHHHRHHQNHQQQHHHHNHLQDNSNAAESVSPADDLQTQGCAGLGALLAGEDMEDLDDIDEEEDQESSTTADGDQSSAGMIDGLASIGGNHQVNNKSHNGSYGNGNGPGAKGGNTDDLLKAAGHLVDCGDDLVDANGKRRGPRTTIKPKQLETLRRAFESAPKPSRHIREQLATETGLNMRVIQVWFQNRRSKERRMKNSNGSARRFFRPSSRRIRVNSNAAGTPTTENGTGVQLQQQSLIAGARTGVGSIGIATTTGAAAPGKAHGKAAQRQLKQQQQQQQQQQLSPMDHGATEQLSGPGGPAYQQQSNQRPQHNSPSEFGGSSSGGFTNFSDSSNQGDAFAINTTAGQQQQQQQQYLANGSQDLMAMEAAAGGNQTPQPPANINGHQQQPRQQQQYGHPTMKNTPPPPPPQIYGQGGGVPPPPQPPQPQHHQLIMGQQPPHHMQQGHHHHHHLGAGGPQMVQPAMGGLLGHPQGPSVVQW